MKYVLSTILTLFSFAIYGQITPPPPPPPHPMDVNPEIFKVVEEMPRFPGCENLGLNNKELYDCAKTALVDYIADNLVQPKPEVEGMAIVQFVVQKDGTLGRINVVRDPGSGAGQAAADVIHKMNTDGKVWVPGKQRGKVVVVQYTLPVRFGKVNNR